MPAPADAVMMTAQQWHRRGSLREPEASTNQSTVEAKIYI
jgi:hypothetical protein